jgi:hypothetical protein
MAPFPNVEKFEELIRWLADTYHRGALYPIAKRCKINHALVDHWSKGLVAQPTLSTVLRLCNGYELDPIEVLSLLAGYDLRKGPQPLNEPIPRGRRRQPKKK